MNRAFNSALRCVHTMPHGKNATKCQVVNAENMYMSSQHSFGTVSACRSMKIRSKKCRLENRGVVFFPNRKLPQYKYVQRLSQWMWSLLFYRPMAWPIAILAKHTSSVGQDMSNKCSITSVCEIQAKIWTIW